MNDHECTTVRRVYLFVLSRCLKPIGSKGFQGLRDETFTEALHGTAQGTLRGLRPAIRETMASRAGEALHSAPEAKLRPKKTAGALGESQLLDPGILLS